MDPGIESKARFWASSDVFDPTTRSEVSALLDPIQVDELRERFTGDLAFGTGGLRGILGAGTSRMNLYNVRKASAAYASYLTQLNQSSKSIAIAYDSRRFSKEFARAAAEVYAAAGFHVFITEDLRPVPMLSFMVRHFGCDGGVCITASHNPPEYNGYKVYWRTGGQIVPPHDKNVIETYNAITSYDIDRIPFKQAVNEGKVTLVGESFDNIYFDKLAAVCTRPNRDDQFKIVFTPLHGTGGYPVVRGLQLFGFENVHVVEEQRTPDGDFPTVAYPNPEDPEALQMAVQKARELKADLVLGTDPDADRVGIVVRENDDYVFLNGNQIGCLLVEYVLSSRKEAGRLPKNPLVIKTVVTTDLQADIAAHYGAECEETLTGFKWICDLIEQYESGAKKPYREYVCGGEESYGFLADHFVRDKDGVMACCIAAEMVSYYKSQGKTLSNVLDDIFLRHGVYYESLHTLTLKGLDGASKIAAIMTNLRENPPEAIAGSACLSMIDLQKGQIFERKNGTYQPSGPASLPSSNVVQFLLEDGSKISARPSGTEPKIKFYVSVKAPPVGPDELTAAKEHCRKRLTDIEATFSKMAAK